MRHSLKKKKIDIPLVSTAHQTTTKAEINLLMRIKVAGNFIKRERWERDWFWEVVLTEMLVSEEAPLALCYLSFYLQRDSALLAAWNQSYPPLPLSWSLSFTTFSLTHCFAFFSFPFSTSATILSSPHHGLVLPYLHSAPCSLAIWHGFKFSGHFLIFIQLV